MVNIISREDQKDSTDFSEKHRQVYFAGRTLILTDEDFEKGLTLDLLTGLSVDVVLVPKKFKGTDEYEDIRKCLEGIVARSRNPRIKFY